MTDHERPEELTPSEERLLRLLLLLRVEPPDNGALAEAVVRTARWQLLLRGVVNAIGNVATAAAESLAILAGLGPGSKRR
jgi:hypothetical protein